MADSQTQEPNETQLETQAEQVQSTEQSDDLENPDAKNESEGINETAEADNEAVNDPSEDVGDTKPKEEVDTKKGNDLDEDGDEDDEDDEENRKTNTSFDPNVMPQVNVSLLARRTWQVKVYPLKPEDFMSGQIARVFKYTKESLLYILAQNKYSRGKGEMFASSPKMATRVVHNLMKLDFQYPEINIEIIKKNDEGIVEQKALLRYDPKLVRMLCIPPLPRRHGNKLRSRLIGSVFVKNLPSDTTKEMLRVLFPFAAEINYTPDKFKDSTARLVLENRSSVFPCLKAFAKVELGGNILELHPLEKRREYLSESESKTSSTPKEQVAGVKVENEEDKNKEADSKDSTTVESKEKNLSTETKATENKSPQKETPKKTSTTNKNDGAPREYRREFRGRGRGTWFSRRRDQGPIHSYQEKKKVGCPPGKPELRKPEVSSHARANRPDNRKSPLGWDGAGNRSRLGQNQNRGNRGGSSNRYNNNRNNSVWNSRASGGRNRLSSGGGYATSGRADRRFEQQSFGGGMAGASGDVGINVEATKEMMLLQSQLSMAIKNQIAMLNQTQIAVEQAKRGAGIGLTSDLPLASSSGEGSRSFGAGAKRRANQSGFGSDYGDDSFGGKRPNLGLGSQQRSWADESPADYYSMQQSQTSLDYGVDRRTEDTSPTYGNSYNSRNLSQSNAGYEKSPYRYHY